MNAWLITIIIGLGAICSQVLGPVPHNPPPQPRYALH